MNECDEQPKLRLAFATRSPLPAKDSDYLTQQSRPHKQVRGHEESLFPKASLLMRYEEFASKLLCHVQL